jgi:hypothetical protein
MQLLYVGLVGTGSQPHASAYSLSFVPPDGAVYVVEVETTRNMLVGHNDAAVNCSYPFVAVEAFSTSVIRVPTRTLAGPVMFVTELRFCETRCST